MSDIIKFLSDFKKKENQTITHIVKGVGSYHLEKNDIKKLYKLISKLNKPVPILERIGPISPLVIDIDLKYVDKYDERQYTKDYLKQLVLFINEKINMLFSNDDNNHLQVWIMEKENILPAPQNGYESKDGIHLLFPQLISDTKNYIKLIDLIYDSKEKYDNIVKNTCINPSSNDIKEIFDASPYKNGNWYIYGCGKEEEKYKYVLTNIFTLNNDEISEHDISLYLKNPIDIIKKQSVQLNTNKTVEYIGNCIDEDVFKGKTNNINVNMDHYEFDNIDNSNRLKKGDRKHLEGLVDLLSVERASNYEDWINTGFCIHSIAKSKFGYDLWIKFSKKSNKFDLNGCNKLWREMDRKAKDKYTIGSMIHWANKDDPEGYQKLRRDSLSESIIKTIKKEKTCGTHADMAEVIYKYYHNEFVCARHKDDSWYYFDSNIGKWRQTEKGHELRKRLSTDIVDVYEFYAAKYKSMRGDDVDSDEYEKYDKYHSCCYAVILKLKDGTYKDKIMKECREKFYDEEFNEKINRNLNIIGLDNCVIDLYYEIDGKHDIVFREGIPDDYITISMGYKLPINKKDLPISYKDASKKIEENQIDNEFTNLKIELDNFFLKILPYEDVREYTLRFLSSCLSGEVPDQKFYMWTGSGSNGKSLLVKLVQFALGDYSRTMDVSYITKERGGSSAASPELEAVKYARFVSLSEPEKHDTIYVGKMKQITGGDKMVSRGLFKDSTEFKPQFKMVLQCNDLPSIPNVDGGVARRIEVVDFPSKFTENPRPTKNNPHQYQKDGDLERRMPEWNMVFLFKLLDYYIKFRKEGTKAPPSVTEATQIYLIDNDIVQKWIKEDLVECEDTISFNSLYSTFTSWCDNEGSNYKKIHKKDIKKMLEELQQKSSYGLNYGQKPSEEAPNGTKRDPKFNFCSKYELDD